MIDKYFEFTVPASTKPTDPDRPPAAYNQLHSMFKSIGLNFRFVGDVGYLYFPNHFYAIYGKDSPKEVSSFEFHIPYESRSAGTDINGNALKKYEIRVIASNGTFIFANPVSLSADTMTVFTVFSPEYLGQARPHSVLKNKKIISASTIEIPDYYTYYYNRHYYSGFTTLLSSLSWYPENDEEHSYGIAVPVIDQIVKDGKRYAFPNPNIFQYSLRIPYEMKDENGRVLGIDYMNYVDPGTKFEIHGQKFLSLGNGYYLGGDQPILNQLALRLI